MLTYSLDNLMLRHLGNRPVVDAEECELGGQPRPSIPKFIPETHILNTIKRGNAGWRHCDQTLALHIKTPRLSSVQPVQPELACKAAAGDMLP